MENANVLQLKNRKFPDFYLCFCGYSECSPLHSFGPAVRPNYILHYIIRGKGVYQAEGERYELQAGEGFLIEPEIRTFYQADADEPWTYLWIGFNGERAEEYLKEIGLGGSRLTFHCTEGEKLEKMMYRQLENSTYSVENDFLSESFLCSFFAVLAHSMELNAPSGPKSENMYVRKALEYIQNNYSYGIKVSDAAAFVGISRSYLYTLFLKTLGLSPQEYLISYRITRASQLLVITDLPVEGIAQSCGYEDPLVFSKAFKKRMGMTPVRYRKVNQ